VGYINFTRKLKEYPAPLDQLLISEAKRSSIEEMNLQMLQRRLLPIEIMKRKEETQLLLYSLGGDSKQEERKKLLQNFKDSFIMEDPDAFLPSEGESGSIAYFFDADKKGVEKRYKEITEEINSLFEKHTIELTIKNPIAEINNVKLGAYIFADPENDSGKLEDILLPLMRIENETIFDNAKNYIDDNRNKERHQKLKIHIMEGVIGEKRDSKRMKFDLKKSIIGIAGQLQNSGASNIPVIRDCDYLTLDKIKSNKQCQNIIKFFEDLTDF